MLTGHHAGNSCLWLTADDDPMLVAYAKGIGQEPRSQLLRVAGDHSAGPVEAKIAEAEHAKGHTMPVVGQRDLAAGAVNVRLQGKGNVGAKPNGEVVAEILATIRDRRVWTSSATRPPGPFANLPRSSGCHPRSPAGSDG